MSDILHRIATPDGEVAYRTAGSAGSGKPLLLLHSLGTSGRMWQGTFDEFAARGYFVVAPDYLGHGDSDKPRHFGFGIRDHARVAKNVITGLGIGPCFVAGTSLGSQVSIELSAAYPRVVKRLVLNGAPGWHLEEQRMARIQTIAQKLIDDDGLPRPFGPELAKEDSPVQGERANAPGAEQDIRNADLAKAGRWFWETAWAIAAYDLYVRLPYIDCPTLVLMGELDFHLPTSYALAHDIPDASMIVLPAPVGHISPLDDPIAVARACDEFFAAQD